MRSDLLLLSTSLLTAFGASAQDNIEKPSIKVGGYVRTEAFFDTYKSTDSRDGEIYFYPLAKKLDDSGNDINKQEQLQLLSLVSRLRASIIGGTALNAKVSGLMEVDFSGSADEYKYMVTLRHAYIKMDWSKTQLLAGQYWHTTSIAEFMPNTVSFGSGSPFQPFCRSTQLRVTNQVLDDLKVIAAISSFSTHKQKEASTIGSPNTQRISALPDIQLQLQYGNVNKLFLAVTGSYKWLKPALTTTSGTGATTKTYRATEVLGSYNFQACAGYQLPLLSIKTQINYIENATPYNMIGGYSPINETPNLKGETGYSNINTVSVWGDLETKGEKLKFGLFGGYTESLGSSDKLNIISCYTRDADLRKVIRISPRVIYVSGPVDYSLEYMVTSAGWGTYQGDAVKQTMDVTKNHRFLIAVRYSF